jgi:hypothetical protein
VSFVAIIRHPDSITQKKNNSTQHFFEKFIISMPYILETIMSALRRFTLVVIAILFLLICAGDYLLYHGDYILTPFTNGYATAGVDSFIGLFQGEGALYFTFLLVCMLIGVVAILYKFVLG